MARFNIDDVIKTMQAEIAELRMKGQYPIGMEEQLEAEFKSIMDLTRLSRPGRIEKLNNLLHQLTDNSVEGTSRENRFSIRWKFNHSKKKLVNQSLIQNKLLVELVGSFQDQHNEDERIALARSKHVLDRVAVIDHLALLIVALENRIDSMEAIASLDHD